MTTISQVPQPTKIVFGTDGWRARVADEFTFENVRRCADGVARYVVDRGEQAKGVVIAYDRRFASEHFAAAAAEVLLAHDIPVAFARHAVPTQMSSYEVVERGAAAGIVITASHNPWTDNGFKVKAPTGSAAGPEILAVLEAAIATNGGTAIERRPFADAEAAGLVDRYDPYAGYEKYVRRTVDLDALKAADVRVLVDPMWGAGAGWLPRLLAGGRIRVHEIHSERNPYFGGVNPEPIRPNIDEALGILAERRLRPGPAARRRRRPGRGGRRAGQLHPPARGDRAADVLPGRVPRPARSRSSRASTTRRWRSRLGKHYGIPVYETSVGFKYIGPKMIETGAMMGAEESGGYGFGMHLPERDGVYADLLLLDLFLHEKAAGRWPVSKALADFHELAGPSFYRRIDVHVEQGVYAALKDRLLVELRANGPTEPGRCPGRADRCPDHQRRLQVLHRRRIVAAGPVQRDRAARPGLHRGDHAGDPRRRSSGPGRRSSVLPEPTVPGSGPDATRRVHKPWGHELIWTQTDQYVGKLIVIDAGRRLSLQKHLEKDESILVISGRLRLHLEADDGSIEAIEMGPGDHRRVPVGRIHRFEAIEQTELVEVSTPQLDDVIRLEDDYGREGTSAP